MLLVLILLSFVCYGLMSLMPGDPLDIMISSNPKITSEDIARLKAVYGLDQPMYMRYWAWLTDILSGDFGYSRTYKVPTSMILVPRLFNTFVLTMSALILSLMISIPIGIISAIKKGSKFDYFTNLLAFAGISIPSFFLAIVLIIIFAVWLEWFPAGGTQSVGEASLTGMAYVKDRIHYLVLPVISLMVLQIGTFVRYTRSAMMEVLGQDYIRTARAKGIKQNKIVYLHALKNALIPLITVISISFSFIFSGAIITETIFAYQGVGRLVYDSIMGNDYNVAMIAFIISIAMVLIMSDWISWFVDLSKVDEKEEISLQSINCAKFPKGMLSQTLRDFLTSREQEQGVDLYLGAKKTQIEAFYEIPTKNLFSKGQVNLFEDEVEQVFQQLYQSIDSGESHISKLKCLLKESLQKTKYKYIKVVSIVHDIFDEWIELSDDHDKISRFELDLFKEIAILDLPRNYFLPLSKDMSGEVFTVDDLIVRDASKTNILVVASHLSSIRSMQSDYPDKLEKSLCALGPIRRPEFDFCILKEEILDFIGEKNTVLLLEGGVIDSSLDWNEILRNCSLEYFEIGGEKHAPRSWDVTTLCSKSPNSKA